MLEVVILAAGKGTRMRSQLPKVLHTIAGKPLLAHVIERAKDLQAANTHLVIGFGAQQVREAFVQESLTIVEQKEQLGTGHAVQQAAPNINDDAVVLILYGDVPLIQTSTLDALLKQVSKTTLALLTIHLVEPSGYGRIVRNDEGKVEAIVEHKDATEKQRKITEINTGVMAVNGRHLKEWLPLLQNKNTQGEYYLTDIIEIARKNNVDVLTTLAQNEHEVMGVNDRIQQAELERIQQRKIANDLMIAGVTIFDPARFDCRGDLKVGEDSSIDINCIFEGSVIIGAGVSIGPNCCIKNSTIGDNSVILANTIIDDSHISDNCNIGPFARVRPGSRLESGAKLGNFVETKKAHIGKNSKVNHLSYIGDAELGEDVNIGAGAITCNYDGANKHLTKIGDGVFVGSNSALVAPVYIGADATIGAGAVVTADVGEKQLVIARSRQQNIEGWKRPAKK